MITSSYQNNTSLSPCCSLTALEKAERVSVYYTINCDAVADDLDNSVSSQAQNCLDKLKRLVKFKPNKIIQISYAELANKLHVTKKTIGRYVKELEKKHYLKVIRGYNSNRKAVNRYQICSPIEAIKEINKRVQQRRRKAPLKTRIRSKLSGNQNLRAIQNHFLTSVNN